MKEQEKSDDLKWKFKALDIAVREMLEYQGKLELDNLFERAKQLYNKGYEEEFLKWSSFWTPQKETKETEKGEEGTEEKEEPSPAAAATEEPKIELSKDGKYKICPECGDEVPVAFPEHIFGTKGYCGYKF